MESSLFYTFSTIAQSLAAGIAFLGAFVLFRLQAISQQLQVSALVVTQKFLGDDKLLQLASTREYGQFCDHADALLRQPTPSGWKPSDHAALVGMRHLWAQRNEILGRLRMDLAFGVALIAASVAILASVPSILTVRGMAMLALLFGVIAFGAILIRIARSIWKAVNGA